MTRQSSPNTLGAILPEVRVEAFHRPGVAPSTGLGGGASGTVLDGLDLSGFAWDGRMRVEEVRWNRGIDPGHASISIIPLDEDHSVEYLMQGYTTDDQVRIFGVGTDAQFDQGGGKLLFGGVLARAPWQIEAQGDQERESLRFVAFPYPTLDNKSRAHLIAGRYIHHPSFEGGGNSGIRALESPDIPAVFNFEGLPNKGGSKTFQTPSSGLSFQVFTYEEDKHAEWWTVRDALASVLGYALTGVGDTQDRFTGIEPATLAALNDPAMNSGRWAGMNARCPEVDVHGLGVFDAVAAICEATGFNFSTLPRTDEQTDREYELRIWRKGAGRENDIKLQKAEQFSDDPVKQLKRNDASQIRGMYDAAPIRNEVYARARTLIETSVVLKPLWNPGEVDGTTVDGKLQDNNGSTSYHDKHVAGGSDFEQYGHVGRLWGVDCGGWWTSDGNGYGSGNYAHDANGFDWVDHLGISGSGLETERQNLGITDPIVWSRRPRVVQPLTDPSQRLIGREFYLEVSEDGGSTWHTVTTVELQTLRSWFGVRLGGQTVANLANVSVDKLGVDELPDPSASWWQLIKDETLLFRLTCCVEADHAARYDATRRATSASAYPLARYHEVDTTEHWRAANSVLNTTGAWQKTRGYGTATGSGDYITGIRNTAERHRDAEEGRRVSVSAMSWLNQFDRWRVGDRITTVSGRNLVLNSNAGDTQRAPTVIGMTWRFGGGGQADVAFASVRHGHNGRRGVGGT